jgi:hypothetical protein
MTRKIRKNNTRKILLRYLPRNLSKKDRKTQKNMLLKSRFFYKKNKYYSRKPLKSFKSKKSQHIRDAEKLYKIKKVIINNELERKTGCTKKSLAKIVNKGEGAYYSSGSRPNQTAQSWGIARLASSITGGKAATIDYSILEEGCNKNSIALKLAKKALKKYNGKTRKRKMPKIKI